MTVRIATLATTRTATRTATPNSSLAICFVLAIPVLAGCASLRSTAPFEVQSRPAIERQAEIGQFANWQAKGRIALNTEREAISASLDWQQRGNDYAVSLAAVFGQGAMHVEQNGPEATLQAKGRRTATGPSAELLVLQQLGVRVPLGQLAYWLRGLPGTVGSAQYDRFGRLHTLKYEDPDGKSWRARVKSYNQVDTLELPRTIEITDGVNDIRLVVTQWQFGNKTTSGEPQEQKKPPKRLVIPGATT